MKRITLSALLLLLSSGYLFAQKFKIPLNHKVYDSWNELKNYEISANGNRILYEVNPQRGDGKLIIRDYNDKHRFSIPRAYRATFSADGSFVAFHIKAPFSAIRKAKLSKNKMKQMPKDTIAVLNFKTGNMEKFPKGRSYKLGEDGGEWVAVLTDAVQADDSTKSSKNKKKTDKSGNLTLYNPITGEKHTFSHTIAYAVSKNGNTYGIVTDQKSDSSHRIVVRIFHTLKQTVKEVFSQEGKLGKLNIDNGGTRIAFTFSTDTTKTKHYCLYYCNLANEATTKIADTLTTNMPKGWSVSEKKSPYFSQNGEKLFLYIRPKPEPEPKESLTPDEKVIVDIWSSTDTLLQTQQKVELEKAPFPQHLAVYHIRSGKFIRLESKDIPSIHIANKGDSRYALGRCRTPYRYTDTWDFPWKSDYYRIDINTGKRELVAQGLYFGAYLSPSGRFLTYLDITDSTWYALDIENRRVTGLTGNLPYSFTDEENDKPHYPYPYGSAGWSLNNRYFMVYDRYDIWALDPTGKKAPICITNGVGRKTQTQFRYLKTDPEAEFINLNKPLLLRLFNQKTKQGGFAEIDGIQPNSPKILISGNYLYRFRGKAKAGNRIIWQRESYNEYRDLWTSTLSFRSPRKLSNANPQMKNYLWGSVEPIKWVDFNGDSIEGLLYKPESFDASRKYPMLVYFYEKNSHTIHRHYEPKPGRSIICPTYYASNGYLVFIPDIKYRIGYPGESAYNAVISGTMALINKGFVDKNRIGVQGQSWGGYQIAYLVTRTDLFRCASPGAPVSNMTSAYGGIRWASGLARMFQYEHTQSRIGGTLWDKPFQYIENSPLFFVPKINTPLLIRHDDADGAVPWYQGIEFFLALRRLGKTAWLVNYNDEPHNLSRRANMVDWTIRMQQFFDYYLKGTPMPRWMKYGIPARQKGKTLGYDPAD